MKKLFILILPLIITGCMNASGVLNSTCTKTTNAEKQVYNFTYFKGNIESLNITKTYFVDVKNTLLTEQLIYQSFDGVKIDVTDNTIYYEFDLSKVDNNIKERYNILDTYQKQVDKLEELGFTCK